MTTTLNVAGRTRRYTWADGKKRLGAEPSSIVITGTGFGAGPSVVIYERWGALSSGAAPLGSFDAGHYNTGLLPSVFVENGVGGIGCREGGTVAAVDNRQTGFVKALPAHDTYFVAFDMAVPSGRHFSGASAPLTLNPSSNLKMDWSSDEPLDSATKADMVAFTRLSASSWAVAGNTAPAPVYVDNGFDFGLWNGFQCLQKAGAPDPFIDSGVTEVVQTTSAGTFTKKVTNLAVFDSAATAAQYTHVNFPGWSGNGSQDLTQHIFSYYYRATGANAGKRVELTNSGTYANATKRKVVKADTWSDTSITVTAEAWQTSGMTHWFVVDDGTIIGSGAL